MMSRIRWDVAQGVHDGGVDHAVLYLPGRSGVPWNGLISVTEPITDWGSTHLYFDGQVIGSIERSPDFDFSISAYTYPDEFELCLGIDDIYDQQPKQSFGLVYRTGTHGKEKLHLAYNSRVKSNPKDHSSIGFNTTANVFRWDIHSTPLVFPKMKPTAHLIVDLNSSLDRAIELLVDTLYGTDVKDPSLPNPYDIFRIFDSAVKFQVIDHEDGSWTAVGTDEAVSVDSQGFATISWPTVDLFGDEIRMTTDY